jgi:hypothetical protein
VAAAAGAQLRSGRSSARNALAPSAPAETTISGSSNVKVGRLYAPSDALSEKGMVADMVPARGEGEEAGRAREGIRRWAAAAAAWRLKRTTKQHTAALYGGTALAVAAVVPRTRPPEGGYCRLAPQNKRGKRAGERRKEDLRRR